MGPIIDYLIIVPLDEEYGYVREIVEKATVGRAKMQSTTIGPQVYSRAIIETVGGPASAVMLSVGRMTEGPFQAAVEEAVRQWRPSATILIGIAGSLDPERLRLGDIIVPRKIVGYTEAKAEPSDDRTHLSGAYRMVYRPTGHSVDCELAAQARALKLDHLSSWQRECSRSLSRDKVLAPRVLMSNGKPRKPEIHIHDNDVLASGNVVVASKAFADDIRTALGDMGRMVKAVEMEAKGFCEGLIRTRPMPQALIVRGISDYADEAKASLEAESKDRWRRLAAQNAARFALAFIARRPSTAEDYRSVASPVLDMTPHAESARLCMEERIDAREAGMRAIAFKPFLVCNEGRPRMNLRLCAYDDTGQVVEIQDVLLRQADGRELWRMRRTQAFAHPLERTDNPTDLELFVGINGSARHLVATVTDEFSRQFESSWSL